MSPFFRPLSWSAAKPKAVVLAARALLVLVGALGSTACKYEADRSDGSGVSGAAAQGGAAGCSIGGVSRGARGDALIECSGECVNTKADASNCGACGNACGASQHCLGGTCSCLGDKQLCDAECVDIATNPNHCSACGNACDALEVCQLDLCQPDCDVLLKCGRACVDPQSNVDHCGACDQSCLPGQTCRNGQCECLVGQNQCGDACVSRNDRSHCGGCNAACDTGSVCSDGQCVFECRPWETNCEGSCFDLAENRDNCDACGEPCPTEQLCHDGTCGCPGTKTPCGDACVDLETDRAHCGTCDHPCPRGSVCSNGSCRISCQPTQTECSGACVELGQDQENCGACGAACAREQSCRDGVCACSTNQTLCSEACVDMRIDPANCGLCGEHCPGGQVCVAGECSAGPDPEPRCQSTLPISLNAQEGWPREAPPKCNLLPDGTGRMTYTLPACGDGPYAGCVFANGVSLDAFDADNEAGGILEVVFCSSRPITGELNLWYGAFPTRKKIELLGSGEPMGAECRTVHRAPEQAVCHWTAHEDWSGTCGGPDVPGLDKTCRECGSRCNQGCPIHFSSTRLTLVAEQCSVPEPDPVDIDLRSVRFLPKDCACTNNAQCEDSPDRTRCETGLFSSSVCPVGAPICGACVSPTPTCSGSTEPCGDVCVDTATDAANCAGCGVVCDPGEVCSGGECVIYCPPGLTECSGACVDLDSDPERCGACGDSCTFDNGVAACVDGVCRLAGCTEGFGDADNESGNGCECIITDPNDDPCDGYDNDCDGVTDWVLDSLPHSSCKCYAESNLVMRGDLGSPNGSVEQCRATTCQLLPSGALEMSYCFNNVCSSVYATCVFAGPTALERFDVDFGNDGFLEVTFEVMSPSLVGKLHLSYGKNPSRKYVPLVERGQSLPRGIYRKYFAPEQLRYSSASPICTEMCGLCPAVHDDPRYRFNATDMTLVGEGCASPVDGTIRLHSVRVASRGCACITDSDCARHEDRNACERPNSGTGMCGWPARLAPGMCGEEM